jgi:hypothetical protein
MKPRWKQTAGRPTPIMLTPIIKIKYQKKNIDKMMSTNPKESVRTDVIENIYQTPNYRPQVGDAINMAPMEALNDDYEQFELGYFMPIGVRS